jgi:hypothetical protein
MIECTDLRCKYCNDKGKCTNKNVKLTAHGVNTRNQGFKNFLECKSFEYHPWYDKAMEFVKRLKEIEEEEKNEPK